MSSDVTLLCLDVDGVLTDGGIHIDDHGVETKRFHVRDGAGIRMWRRLGGEVAVITGRRSGSLRHRLAELGVRHVVQGAGHKGEALEELCAELRVEPRRCAMIGDDLPDLPALRVCGYPMAVFDAAAEVKALAQFVTVRPGGVGAVREAIEHLLRAQGRWAEALALWE
jgi:3-deoxy-D-manno-octulosonate 8-phosphate phosphatase (KDO 8-P phosphatase)